MRKRNPASKYVLGRTWCGRAAAGGPVAPWSGRSSAGHNESGIVVKIYLGIIITTTLLYYIIRIVMDGTARALN